MNINPLGFLWLEEEKTGSFPDQGTGGGDSLGSYQHGNFQEGLLQADYHTNCSPYAMGQAQHSYTPEYMMRSSG